MAEESLDSTIKVVASKIAQAAEGLVTVKVRTLVGNQALADNATQAGVVTVAQGTQGAYTSCNMAEGDIIACYSDAVASPDQVKALHDESVALGTKIFRDNIAMLKQVLLDLIDKQRTAA